MCAQSQRNILGKTVLILTVMVSHIISKSWQAYYKIFTRFIQQYACNLALSAKNMSSRISSQILTVVITKYISHQVMVIVWFI